MLPAYFRRLLLSLRRPEFLRACRVQNRSAAGNDIRHITCRKVHDLCVQQPLVALIDALYIHSLADCLTDNRTDRRIHARRVPAACQHTDCLDL